MTSSVEASGIAVVVVGITLVKGYEIERDVRMGLNDTVSIENYSFELTGVSDVDGPSCSAICSRAWRMLDRRESRFM